MTDQEINIAIAEACGWEWRNNDDNPEYGWQNGNGLHYRSLPAYCTDLNVMHEAEKVLQVNQWGDYMDTLYRIAQDPHICPTTHCLAYVCATARQRAEAFLRTIGKWKEGKQ